jgi:hypothetical protein
MLNDESLASRTAIAKLTRTDPPRIDKRTGREIRRVRVKVRVRPTQQVLPGGQLALGDEDNYFEMYEDEAALICDGVKNPRAKPGERDERKLYLVEPMLETATDEQLARVDDELDARERQFMATAEKKAEAISDDIEREKFLREERAKSPNSFEAAFLHVMHREMRPVLELEVLSDIAEPEPEPEAPAPKASKASKNETKAA